MQNCSGQTRSTVGTPIPRTTRPLDADYWGARLRACFDGAFYDGGQWLYNGQSMAQVLAARTGRTTRCGVASGPGTPGAGMTRGAQSYIA